MDPYAENDQPPPRRRRGCLGCLGVLFGSVLVVAAVFAIGSWYFYYSLEHDDRLAGIMQTVRADAGAQALLGDNIHILEVERHTFNYTAAAGHTATYTLHIAGTYGEGELKVNLDLNGDHAKVTLIVLTGSDGHPHVLTGNEPKSPLAGSI